jgi:drug/metabolite transporter (DMT)-like permease
VSRRPSPFLVHLACFTVAALFSANYIISKLGMRAFAPLSFAYLRVLGSALLLAAVLPREREPITRDDQWRLAGFAILGVVINQALFLMGLAFTTAHVAAILITTIPVFALAAAILLGRERATLAKTGGIALAAAGALLIVGGEGLAGDGRSLIGALMIVGNCSAYALYLVLSKPMMTRLSARRVLARMFAIAAVAMLPICAWSLAHEEWRAIPQRAWLSLLLVILGPTVLAYVINGWTLRHTDSSTVAAYTYVQPVLTTILAALFLGETIGSSVVVAAVMIFAGVWLSGRPAPPAAREEAVPGNPD